MHVTLPDLVFHPIPGQERKPPTKRVKNDDTVTVQVLGDSSEQPTKKVQVMVDHDYQITNSPRKLKRHLENSHDEVMNLQKILRNDRQNSLHLKK